MSLAAECNGVEGPRRFVDVLSFTGPPGSCDFVQSRLRPHGTPLRMTRVGNSPWCRSPLKMRPVTARLRELPPSAQTEQRRAAGLQHGARGLGRGARVGGGTRGSSGPAKLSNFFLVVRVANHSLAALFRGLPCGPVRAHALNETNGNGLRDFCLYLPRATATHFAARPQRQKLPVSSGTHQHPFSPCPAAMAARGIIIAIARSSIERHV